LDTEQRLADFKTEMIQIALVQDFTVINEPDLIAQEDVDINFTPDDDVFIQDRYEEDMELADYTLIHKTTLFDPPEDIELTELLRYNLDDLISKESCVNYFHYSVTN
jgi:hypothetical protein